MAANSDKIWIIISAHKAEMVVTFARCIDGCLQFDSCHALSECINQWDLSLVNAILNVLYLLNNNNNNNNLWSSLFDIRMK